MADQGNSKPKTLIVVAGPTAVGKTDLAIDLARQLDTEILSADSRQVFREMTVGTAKPLPQEQGGIPHHFIDSHSIIEEYSAGIFEKEALAVLERLFQNHDTLILVGGSGLYVRALCEGMDEMPPVDPGIREQLIREGEERGVGYLLELLRLHDPLYHDQVDQANTQRLIRALEVSISSGQPYSSFRKGNSRHRPFRTIKIGLTRDRAELYDRIDQRVDLMLEQGLLAEASALYPHRAHPALQTVGYQEIFGFLESSYDWEEAIRLLKRNSRRYAKRQLTWFRRDPEYRWFHPGQLAEILAYLQESLKV